MPYVRGLPFYEPKNITDANLTKLVIEHSEELRKSPLAAGETCCLFGGFVLKINGQDRFLPQCCGDLSDLHFWKAISQKRKGFYTGHPAPAYRFCGNSVVFDFGVEVRVGLKELAAATVRAEGELNRLARRVLRVNAVCELGIEEVRRVLVFG